MNHDHDAPPPEIGRPDPFPAELAHSKPRVWTAFVAVIAAIVVAVLLQIVFAAILTVQEASRGTDRSDMAEAVTARLTTPGMFMWLAASGQLAFLLACAVPAWLSPVPFRKRLGLVPARPSRKIYPLAMFGSLVPLAVGLGLAHALARVLPPDPSLEALFNNMTLGAAVPFVVFIGLAPGFAKK